ncbi:MAG TPA: hypothetical protein VN761_02960, partial [Candidatus Polarisedimenticolia bacterium]|nr:hypothetical protein [Candidatus Polarisedimenticolia bacterium]
TRSNIRFHFPLEGGKIRWITHFTKTIFQNHFMWTAAFILNILHLAYHQVTIQLRSLSVQQHSPLQCLSSAEKRKFFAASSR